MVIAPEVWRDEEYLEPKIVLEDAKVLVKTASVQAGPTYSKAGMRAIAEVVLAEADPEEYEAVVFVGGAGASVFFDDPAAHELARNALDAGKVVAAICIAPSTLARAGLLEGRSATAFESQEDDLVAHGANYTGEPVEVDGRIVTANGPAAATAFGEAILTLMNQAASEQ
jgi:protease I